MPPARASRCAADGTVCDGVYEVLIGRRKAARTSLQYGRGHG